MDLAKSQRKFRGGCKMQRCGEWKIIFDGHLLTPTQMGMAESPRHSSYPLGVPHTALHREETIRSAKTAPPQRDLAALQPAPPAPRPLLLPLAARGPLLLGGCSPSLGEMVEHRGGAPPRIIRSHKRPSQHHNRPTKRSRQPKKQKAESHPWHRSARHQLHHQ